MGNDTAKARGAARVAKTQATNHADSIGRLQREEGHDEAVAEEGLLLHAVRGGVVLFDHDDDVDGLICNSSQADVRSKVRARSNSALPWLVMTTNESLRLQYGVPGQLLIADGYSHMYVYESIRFYIYKI